MKSLVVTLAAMAALTSVGVVVTGGAPIVPATIGSNAFVLQLDWLVGIIETIDRLLEAIVDLLRTIRRLFGGGGD
ncbi:hypothetical protein [Halococcus saccharolyticus]|uniref:Uncharacterized protein n=1 Tax=Halococcus saccharolyticus DSM 5350 TaxID=1227455 RepID=M0ML84_9EURY|nr:hypothetical protein [Halococcus saccharolyticus]EMA45205.1 hypothetical protein C449_07957 [Halococcus saccharolyticus DSM 5350]